jgi:hypothetical protein
MSPNIYSPLEGEMAGKHVVGCFLREINMKSKIRLFNKNDINDLIQITLLAFEPVFISFGQILGSQIFPIIYPDWRKSHKEEVEQLSDNEKIFIWVAEVGSRWKRCRFYSI